MITINRQLKGSIYLIICSFFWGICFTAQDTAMDYIEPFTFVFMRSVLTFLVLFAFTPLINKITGSNNSEGNASVKDASFREYMIIGILLGAILVFASVLQQIGLLYTTPAKSGFVTALYIVLVPLLGLFVKRRVGVPVWIGVALSLAGLCLLCIQSDLTINVGDFITLGSALVFSFHILVIDRFGSKLNSFKLSTVQFATCAVIAGVITFIAEDPDLTSILACIGSIIYAAVFSGAIGYTLQMVGQKYTDPTLASLIMCLESVFAAIGGWVLLGQTLSIRELTGCALMLAASMIAQLPGKKKIN